MPKKNQFLKLDVDVIVEPENESRPIRFAQSMDRTGYSRGTLAVREGLQAKV